jgi:hypothetical protein
VTRKIHITRDVTFLKRMLFQNSVDEVAVVPIITQDVTSFDTGESNNGTELTETRSKTSWGDGSDNHSDLNPDSESEDEDGEPPDGKTGEWHTTRPGRTSCVPSRYRTEIDAAAINCTKNDKNYYSLLLDEDEDEDCENEDE